MKFRYVLVSVLFGLGELHAQTCLIEIKESEWHNSKDSVVLQLELAMTADNLKSIDQVCLTPVLKGLNQAVTFPKLYLNSKQAERKKQRELMLNRRKGKPLEQEQSIVLQAEKQQIVYRGAVAASYIAPNTKLEITKEVFLKNGKRIQNEVITATAHKEIANETLDPRESVNTTAAVQDFKPLQYKGSYIAPETDEIDERNQKELNFSLEEARVMADVTPEMLSLRELYTVALSYKNEPEKFYQVIFTSVRIYPAHPIANQNAAAASLEQGNLEAAGRFLQVASHETLAYKSCRGIYELMNNNLYEGIRLLKAAKAEGSEEAANNLKLFFEAHKSTN